MNAEFQSQLATVRPVTQDMIESALLDCYPRNAAICDFGLNSQKHYEALVAIIRANGVSPEALDKALGDGPALTKLVNDSPDNPHKGIVFVTPYDDMPGD